MKYLEELIAMLDARLKTLEAEITAWTVHDSFDDILGNIGTVAELQQIRDFASYRLHMH